MNNLHNRFIIRVSEIVAAKLLLLPMSTTLVV